MVLKRCVAIAAFAVGITAAAAQGILPDETQKHTTKGYELYEAGQYRAAMVEFRKALESASGQDAVKLRFLAAESAARTGESGARQMLESFIEENPSSAYVTDARFAMANMLYAEGNHQQARREYARVGIFDLPSDRQDEYNFKFGHSFFMTDDEVNARTMLARVDRDGQYGPHARYYIAYIDYVNGNYASAKREFSELMRYGAYEKIVPFYLLQIEFLEGNYDYVIANGDQLLQQAVGSRRTEIERILAESWFHKRDYERTLHYMKMYAAEGGQMGREENYLVGYSSYMRNDIGDAISYLSLAVGPDDMLTQNAAYHLASAYLRTGDKVRAMQSFSMASDARYDEGIREDALFNYGKLQYELGGGIFNEAINVLNRYLAEYPASPRADQAREFLIAAYYNSRNYEAAYDAISQIQNPDNNLRTAYQKIAYFRALEYYNNGDFDRAYSMLEESLRNRFNPKYTALTQFWKAEILYLRGNYREATPLYREYISLSPPTESEYEMAQYNLGYSYFNLSQWQESRSWFERFLSTHTARDSYRADALNRAGDTYYATRDFGKAISNYDASIAIGTQEQYYAAYQRALALGLTGSPLRKVDALLATINSNQGPYAGDAAYELGRTYIGMERFADGARVLKDFVERYPASDKFLAALSDLGLAYQNMNDNASALRYYQMLVDKAPSSPQARDAMLAVKSIYVDMNDVDGYFAFAAKTGVETDLGNVARDSLTYVAAERIYMGAGDNAQAISAFRDYLSKFPRGVYRPNALFNLSDVYTRLGQHEASATTLKELAGMHYNQFTVRGLEKLAPLSYEARQWSDAADAYRQLAQTAVNPQTVSSAWSGYLRSVKAMGDRDRLETAADEIIAAKGVNTETLKEARFTKATVLEEKGQNQPALAIYTELATEVQTAEGAESTYKVIQALYDRGELDAVEKKVLEFAGRNTPHSYWLGKAFLTLGDVYIQKGDNFQARATLQSIVDGYSPSNDGIVEAARQKISTLGE